MNKISHAALERRLGRRGAGMKLGPSGGAKLLSPQNSKSAGSMIKPTTPQGGRGKGTRALAQQFGKHRKGL